MPFRMNLVSSLAAAGSCLFVFLTVSKTTGNRPAGLFAALAWGFSFELWSQATALEVYALNALLLSAAIYAVSIWAEEGRFGSLALAAFAIGLGLANHLTIVLWLPGLLVAASQRPFHRLGRGHLLTILLLVLAGPALYAAVPFLSRPDQLGSWGGITSLSALYQFITGRTYQYRIQGGVPGYLGRQLALLPGLLGKQFLASWLLVIPGVAWCLDENRRLGLALFLSFVLCTGFAVAYNIPDKEGFYLPAYLAVVLCIGLGFARVTSKRRTGLALAGFALLLLPLALYYQSQDRHRLRGLRDLSESLIAEVPEGSVLFTDEYSSTHGLRWLFAERAHEQFLVVNEHLLAFPWYLEALSRRAAVSELTFDLARQLWQAKVRGARFGELAKSTTQQIKLLLVREWIGTRPLFWMPAEFHSWSETWQEYGLRLQGLTYQITTEESRNSGYIPHEFSFPGPDRYRTTEFRDAETQDLCRRFAAAANRRGILRFSVGDGPGAIADFNLALNYFPGLFSAIENKGIVFFYSDQPDSARHYLNAYLKTSPNEQEAAKVRAFLKRLGE